MKKIKDKSKMYMILGISFLVLSVLGSTYAYYKYVIATINVDTITRGLDYYINYTKGTDITSAALNPGSDYTSGNSLSITLYKKDNTYTIYGHIYLDISSISTNLSSSGALKYAVLEGNTKIFGGKLTGVASGNSVPLAVNIPLKTTSTKYTVYLWLDENEENYMLAENTSISATVRCEATIKQIKVLPYGITGEYFYNKYNPNTTVINNNITYNYDTTNNLMQDVGGNLRFYGESPNNYIYFNCDDYSSQSASTCETWQIIGVFDGKLKLIKNESIGKYSWDNDEKNDWSDASLMKLLNPGYESETVGGSLYYNSGSGNCYAGGNNATTACDFRGLGIKNDNTRNLISGAIYFLGGYDSDEPFLARTYSNQYYNYERGTKVYTGRPITWTGKVALPYLSDYGYATDFSKCSQSLYNYGNVSTCIENNWMYELGNREADREHILLTPDFKSSSNVYRINYDVLIKAESSIDSEWIVVLPVLYLSPEASIASGSGTSSNPYKISIN